MTKDVPFYVELAQHISEKETFSLLNNEGQYPTIHWVIARSMLEDFSEFDRHQLLTHKAGQVKRSLEAAINYLQDNNIVVYKSIGANKRNIEFVTTDPDYKHARDKDFRRRTNNLKKHLGSFKKHVPKLHSDKAHLVIPDTKRLGTTLNKALDE